MNVEKRRSKAEQIGSTAAAKPSLEESKINSEKENVKYAKNEIK